LAGLEALSAGLPIITTSANGVSEVITPGIHGEVIDEPSDVSALVTALRKWLGILSDRPRLDQACSACAALASEFTLEKNLKQTLTVIREVMEEKAGRTLPS
ncbi:MAG: glycosyltransferase, partial [Verrucomicrobia bacterium]|nr:glycosyltransferase [Verrucomicrobiota bacterium]